MSQSLVPSGADAVLKLDLHDLPEYREPLRHSEVSMVPDREFRVNELLRNSQIYADELAALPNAGNTEAPLKEMEKLAALGLLIAPLPERFGGLGLGTESNGHLPLLRLLSIVGGADLVLGRLYEGHVNALILTQAFGTEAQLSRASEDARRGLLSGVWNTGEAQPLKLEPVLDGFRFEGAKTFASGAAFVSRPVVTSELRDHGWQMSVPRVDTPRVREAIKLNTEFWKPLGMEGSESYGIDFTGVVIAKDDLIGRPGDFYRDPLFRGGAIRFAAVQAGAVIRLYRQFAGWLQTKGRGNDPYQIARLGEISIQAQSAVLWIEHAAAVAEECLKKTADKLATERMVECANLTRLAIERISTAVMQHVVAGVGAHGLLRPNPFEKTVKDLTMYLRQPAPDQTLADVGRSSIRKNNLRIGGAENYIWHKYMSEGSLPSSYFEQIYERTRDPWDFETSKYEADKYANTLESLPRARYRCGLEVGSSIGVFTQKLADRCDHLLSIDVSEAALANARERCKAQSNVTFARAQLPTELPAGRYDLVMISEIAYYWSFEDLELGATMLAKHQHPGDHLVLVHLTAPVPDYPLTGDEVHNAWLTRPEWRSIKQERYERYRIDVLERTGNVYKQA